jgi:dTDP-4-dehydrorhamnose reductase
MATTSNECILVLGAEGMLGHKVYQALLEAGTTRVIGSIRGRLNDPFYAKIPLFAKTRIFDNVDVMDFATLQAKLRDSQPRFIVNCVGIIKQRDTAQLAVPTIALNSLLPHLLAEWASKWDGRVIHFSTDCVFSGRRGAYTESDPSDAEDLYGKSKYLGEVTAENALTLRTSIIGRELAHYRSLLEWFLGQAGKRVQGYRRAIYSGVTTNYMAQLVARIIAEKPKLNGLYQVTSSPVSKLELLRRLKQAYGLDIEIEAVDGEVCDRSMRGERFVEATGFVTPDWDTLVDQLASDNTPYGQWRAQESQHV